MALQMNFGDAIMAIWSVLDENDWNVKYVVIIYISYIVGLASCYFLRKICSQSFVNFIKLLKGVLVSIISVMSLKYLNINTRVGVNLLHIYNIVQVCSFLEVFSIRIKNTNNKLSNDQTSIVNKYELDNENVDHHTLIGDASQHLEKITKTILNDKKSLEENKGILKEKELIEQIEQEEKKEEEYMKAKNVSNSKKRNSGSKINLVWIYVLFSKTFNVIYFSLFWKLIPNLIIVKIFLTLQLCTSLIYTAKNVYKSNSNIKLLQKLLDGLNIVYYIFISLFFTKILYTFDDNYNNNLIQNFAVVSIVFHMYYGYMAFVKYIYDYYKQFRPSLFSFILFFHIFSIIGIIKLYHHEHRKSLLIQVSQMFFFPLIFFTFFFSLIHIIDFIYSFFPFL